MEKRKFQPREGFNMEKQLNNKNKSIQLLYSFVVAALGGLVFNYIHMPIPWLLGPMVAIFLLSRTGKFTPYWPVHIRNIGLIIVGYTIGLSFTKDALIQIINQSPSMLLMTVLLVSFSALFALLISKLTKIDYPTILAGSIPGGLSQMITLGEEMKGIDLTIVTFLQVTRLMMIIFVVPLLVISPMFSGGEIFHLTGSITKIKPQWAELFPNIIIFTIVCVIFAIIGKKIKLPTAYMLGPIIGTAILNIGGLHGPSLPSTIVDISQFFMGGYIGTLMKPEQLTNKVKIIIFSLISGSVLILASIGLSFFLANLHPISPITAFLSSAPGGMDQMGIIAHEVHADLSIVTGYQLFRILFIFFAVPPLLKWLLTYYYRKKMNSD
jgi:membrane AbrB-like protein